MNIKEITYPTPLSQIEDIEDDNIDVFVELDDNISYVVVAITPKNYYTLMEKEQVDYFYGAPNIVVKKLTEENIERALKKFASDDAYWLKLYHVAGVFDIENLDQVIKDTNLDDGSFD